jgi:hypothetical protein
VKAGKQFYNRVVLGVLFAAAIGAPAVRAGTLTLPAGTQLSVILETTLSTKTTKAGDRFRARVVMPVWANQKEILPVGTAVVGTVVTLKGPGRVKGRAEMQLRPEKLLLPDGRDILLGASIESAKSDDDTKIVGKEGTVKAGGKEGINKRQAATGAVMGAAVGLATAGGTGAAIGAGAVGAIVLLHQVLKKGKDASLAAGTELVLETTRDVSFSDMLEDRTPAVQPMDQRVPLVTEPSIVPSPAADHAK